ncbi:MAG: hypothetical protein EOP07_11065 [Proteobacteria bacterium]|nr:MAG: hypothetical protein EOP07_11065 [Pseudomonadota bacterium]
MKLIWLILLSSTVACKPIQSQDSESASVASSLKASIQDHKISFSGSPNAKIAYCDSPSDTVEPLVKESADAEWKSASLAEKQGIYILDGELEIFEPNEACASHDLYSVIRAPLFVAEIMSLPLGEEVIGEEKLIELKRIDPETKLTAESKLPSFKTAPVRFAKLDFKVLNADGSESDRFVKEFEIK